MRTGPIDWSALADEIVIEHDSGLRLAGEAMADSRSVTIGAWVASGARDDPSGLAGAHHFLEHMVFRAAGARSGIEISRALDRVGGDINAYTTKEWTSYYCRVPRRHVDLGVELVAELISSPVLGAEDVDSERQVILDELAMDEDSPDDVAARALAAAVFGDHPLGIDTAGDATSVHTITGDDLRRLHRERYAGPATVFAVAGAVDVAAVLGRAGEIVRLPGERFENGRTAPSGLAAESEVHLPADIEQVHLAIGGRGVPRDDPDRPALDVVNHVLGGGLSSRLFDEIRERRGLAYSVYSATASFTETGMWSMAAASLPEHSRELRTVMIGELDRLVADGITDEELEIAIGALVGAYEMSLEDSGTRMSRLAAHLLLWGEVVPVDTYLARWEAVDHDAVARVLQRVYAGPRAIVEVGPRR